ncbi:uncharacterized protein LOC109854970 isoform X2 [Pseudomyrmex gracilis]|uniref:uncharacterized protein LOC109854970 isoform X2 n=1 Tax=Pseudomyrmex gracilis TaxID=219809 RepID=UPI000994D978|nr:uncharacterized protein LOC109854970 isoform X2 [Pseudomyrmex gracilis]
MGKVTKTFSTKKVSPKLKNKRRKRELDKIHSKILKAKSKLDNIEKHGNKSRQKIQNQAKICSRLLPKPVAGIYRNGAKAETSENKINNARLKADALQLFNGDTSESIEDDVEIALFDEPTIQSLNKSFVENSLERAACESEQSPVLGKRHDHNQNVYVVKNKTKNTFSKNLNLNRNRKKNVNKSKNIMQKDVICKQRLFQNDKQLENTGNLQIFNTIDLTQEDTINEEKREEILDNKFCDQFNKNKFWNPLNRFEEFCRKMATGISDGFSQNYRPDPVKTTLKILRVSYAECFRQQLLREKKTQSNTESPVEYQACTYSNSQVSSVEFEVLKCDDKNDTIVANPSESTQKINNLHRIPHFMCEKGNDITQYDSTSRSSQNSFAAYKNSENNGGNQFVNQFSDVSQFPKSVNLYFVNENHSVDSQKNSNHVSFASKQNRCRKNNCYYKHSRDVDKTGRSATLIFSNESVLSAEKLLRKSKLSTVTANTCAPNDIFQKCNRTANEHNNKNIKQIPNIIRRYNDIKVTKSTYSTQLNDICPESLYKKFETTVFNDPDSNVAKESRVEYPYMLGSVPTPSILNMPLDRSQSLERPNKFSYVSAPNISIVPLDRSKLLEPQIESMKIQDFRESQIDNVNINVRSKVKKMTGNNRLSRFSNTSHSQTFENLYNSNTYVKTPVQEIASNARQVFCTNSCHPVTYLQTANIPGLNVEQAKQVSSQTKLHVYEANNAKQQFIGNTTRDQNSNILFNSVSNKIATLNFPQNIQFDKRCGKSTCKKLFSKTDAECVKNLTSQNVCRCNKRCICHDSADCPPKHSVAQMHYCDKDTVQAMTQPNMSYDINIYSSNTDKSVDSSNGLQNASFLPLEQKYNPYTYLQTVDGQHHAVLLQDATQPVKYFAVKNDRGIQRIPVYINNSSANITENFPLKLALMKPNSRTKIYPQEVTNRVIPLQANSLPVDEVAMHKTSAQPVNAVLFNSDLQSNTWYTSNL